MKYLYSITAPQYNIPHLQAYLQFITLPRKKTSKINRKQEAKYEIFIQYYGTTIQYPTLTSLFAIHNRPKEKNQQNKHPTSQVRELP